MSVSDGKDIELWQTTRRRLLKISALTGALLSFDLLDRSPVRKMAFAANGAITPAEMREKAMQLLRPPTGFM
jgi:hypothetical protein